MRLLRPSPTVMVMRTFVGLVAAVLVTMLAGCGNAPESVDVTLQSDVVAHSTTTPGTGEDLLGFWGEEPSKADESNLAWLRFTSGGMLEGFDGCNAVTGTWQLNASTAVVHTDARRQSYAACPGSPTVSFSEMKLSGETLTYTLVDPAGDTTQAQLAKRGDTPRPAA